ncbi:hypothetical protein ZIOFF_022113 [Zingiber officinale]|uniref:Uncharacterized protein n=1 Tax=Zingiber officinale TaxID=94328 RepID=A0A8J5H4P3_ZINOF|nr:hypothetical protein ZIOFF_022113 [Zingiber officinale]
MSGSRKKFGGSRPPSGTPSLPLSCAVVVVSLLAGASIVHNIYKPDLVPRYLYLPFMEFRQTLTLEFLLYRIDRCSVSASAFDHFNELFVQSS